jgi:hypothetical protein
MVPSETVDREMTLHWFGLYEHTRLGDLNSAVPAIRA